MDLHPYDGVTRRFRHTDAERDVGLTIVADLLHLPTPPPADGTLYDLSFLSGGIGIIDNLAITLGADRSLWADIVAALQAETLEGARKYAGWEDELMELVGDEEAPTPLREAAVGFINGKRREFQRDCHPDGRIFFGVGSGANEWLALWGDDATLNYISYDQG